MISRATSHMKNGALRSPVMQLRKVSTWVFSLLMLLVIQQDVFAADAANGEALFKANCARCHSANLQAASTGPALYEVLERVPSREWLYPWIINSAAVIATGDAYAVKVWEDNNKGNMDPMPHLTDENIDDILTWIEVWEPAIEEDASAGVLAFDDQENLTSLRTMITLLVLIVLGLLGFIALQVARLRGIEFLSGINWDKLNARFFLGFFILGMIGSWWSTSVFSDYFLLDNSASEHGAEIDQLFWITMVVVMFVFVVTNAVLFYFCYRYGKDGGRKAKYYPENNKLEMIWTVVPAIVLTILVIFGIRTWTDVMGGPEEGENVLKVEVNGQQWGWTLRYAGNDQTLGESDIRRISGVNQLGVDMSQKVSRDDFISNDMVLRKGQTVDLKIRSRDVLHSVYLPHFRVKMDAVPGMDTRFTFKPVKTTAEYREDLKTNGYWSGIDTIVTIDIEKYVIAANGDTTATYNESVVDTVFLYETFDFELACTEVCGRGHFSMRKKVIVLDDAEYQQWYDSIRVHNLAAQIQYSPQNEFPDQNREFTTNGVGEASENILD